MISDTTIELIFVLAVASYWIYGAWKGWQKGKAQRDERDRIRGEAPR